MISDCFTKINMKRKNIKSYPVVKMYPVMGESKFRFDWVQDNVTDLDVNLVTIGLPGGSGTSVRSKKRKHV